MHHPENTEIIADPIHPGEILFEEFMKPLNLTMNQLARDLDVPVGRISQIINGKRAITSDTALRLGLYFNTTPQLWLGLQMDYELRLVNHGQLEQIKERVRPLKQAS